MLDGYLPKGGMTTRKLSDGGSLCCSSGYLCVITIPSFSILRTDRRVYFFIKKPIIPLTQIPKITINETQQAPTQDPILQIAISDGALVG